MVEKSKLNQNQYIVRYLLDVFEIKPFSNTILVCKESSIYLMNWRSNYLHVADQPSICETRWKLITGNISNYYNVGDYLLRVSITTLIH